MSCSTVSSVLPTVTSLDQLDEARGLALAHAGGRLVEQDHVGAAGDGDADLQRALLGIGEVHRQHVALLARADHVAAAPRRARWRRPGRPGTSRTRSGSPGSTARRSAGSRTPTACGKMLVIWKLRDRPRRLISNGFMPSMRWPLSRISPLVGAKRPLMRLNSVDLPAPFGPMMAMRSPGVHRQVGAADDLGLAEALAQVLAARARSCRRSLTAPPCA